MFAPLIEKLQRREDLTTDEAAAAMGEIMDGRARPAQVAGLLVALTMKGERPVRNRRPGADDARPGGAAVAGACARVRYVRHGRRPLEHVQRVDRAALVLAACGVRVAKHGNRSVSSRCGSADLFEALGVRVDAPGGGRRAMPGRGGDRFFFAPTFHPSMKHAAQARR